ncbi:hypothetical protein HHK36_000589 [Tetracentron sinense]|uniref:DNA (cytosine-5-)-methyltransferase n=1 Tax=Tetracentron sinense TaxID=13715 RepID=A0A834ZVS1_TETSI|nr:hypothetical protein HHK36_000589 [Tetracentron sinense]
MGYQVRFDIFEAGAYGVSQSRKRAFIWATSPEETLPEWPEPMHVFAGPEPKITLLGNVQYAAVRSTASGAPFRAITYKYEPVLWFQKIIRGYMLFLLDHLPKATIAVIFWLPTLWVLQREPQMLKFDCRHTRQGSFGRTTKPVKSMWNCDPSRSKVGGCQLQAYHEEPMGDIFSSSNLDWILVKAEV